MNRKIGLFIAVVAFLFLIFGVDLPDYIFFVQSMKVTKERLDDLSKKYDIYVKKLKEYEKALEKVRESEELVFPEGVSVVENGSTITLKGTMRGKELEELMKYVFERKDVAIKELSITNEKGLPIHVEGAMIPPTNLIKFTMVLERVR